MVFFIVLTSTLLQGWSIPIVARWLAVDAPLEMRPRYPLEFEAPQGIDTDMVDFIIPYNSAISGKSIVDLGMPDDSLVVLIIRNEKFIVPSGGTLLEDGDTILALVNKNNLPDVRRILSEVRSNEQA